MRSVTLCCYVLSLIAVGAAYGNPPLLPTVEVETKAIGRGLLEDDKMAQLKFWIALNAGKIEDMEAALKEGADPNDKTEPSFYRPIHLAASVGNVRAVRLLIRYKADVDAKTVNGTAALHYAANHGDIAVTTALLNANANANIADSRGFVPLHYGSYAPEGTDYNPVPFNGGGYFAITKETSQKASSLMGAINSKKIPGMGEFQAVVKALLAAGAKASAATNDKETPLHYTPAFDRYLITKLLVDAGADVNFKDHEEETPLHEAVAYGAIGVTQVLLLHGADVSLEEENGLTASEFICRCRTYRNNPNLTQCADGKCTDQYDSLVIQRFFDIMASRN